jgi:hypothetical protein
MHCVICRRRITRSASPAALIGPVCLRRITPKVAKTSAARFIRLRINRDKSADPAQIDWIGAMA